MPLPLLSDDQEVCVALADEEGEPVPLIAKHRLMAGKAFGIKDDSALFLTNLERDKKHSGGWLTFIQRPFKMFVSGA
jgi:hypothetical protein